MTTLNAVIVATLEQTPADATHCVDAFYGQRRPGCRSRRCRESGGRSASNPISSMSSSCRRIPLFTRSGPRCRWSVSESTTGFARAVGPCARRRRNRLHGRRRRRRCRFLPELRPVVGPAGWLIVAALPVESISRFPASPTGLSARRVMLIVPTSAARPASAPGRAGVSTRALTVFERCSASCYRHRPTTTEAPRRWPEPSRRQCPALQRWPAELSRVAYDSAGISYRVD